MVPEERRRLGEILAGKSCIRACSVFDPMSARIASDLGFPVGLMGGSVASYAVLGAPDIALLTLSELAEQARRVCRAGEISVIVDADHGYGNALNVVRTVEELAAAGVAGITIEDTLLPRAFGPNNTPQLLSLEEGIGKMRAAVAARQRSGIAILGRTSATAITGVEDAIRRLLAYQQCGVDALFVPGLKTRDELHRIAAAVDLPLVLGAPHQSLCDPDFLASQRVRIFLANHHPFAVAVEALYEATKGARDGIAIEPSKQATAAALLAKLLRTAQYERLTKEFLGAK